MSSPLTSCRSNFLLPPQISLSIPRPLTSSLSLSPTASCNLVSVRGYYQDRSPLYSLDVSPPVSCPRAQSASKFVTLGRFMCLV
ncbi:hypothetical protein FKM82_025852 [Ascaphus truei]